MSTTQLYAMARSGAWWGAAMCLISLASSAAEVSSHYFQTSDGIRIHYLEEGQGVPIVLIHGYTGTAEGNWFANGIAANLSKTNRVIALDCRGHGLSDKPHEEERYVPPRLERDVIELLDQLHLHRAHIHGYSMGGEVVTEILAHDQERVITASYGGSGVEEVDRQRIALVPADSPGVDPREAAAEKQLEALPDQDVAALSALKRAYGTSWGRAEIDLRAVHVPVLAIVGEFDEPNRRLTRMKRELRDFHYVTLSGRSHLTAIMAGYIPPEYLQTLAAFIRAHNPSASSSR
jgi:pimeloyl-ACP methyl ester carboxylesterase